MRRITILTVLLLAALLVLSACNGPLLGSVSAGDDAESSQSASQIRFVKMDPPDEPDFSPPEDLPMEYLSQMHIICDSQEELDVTNQLPKSQGYKEVRTDMPDLEMAVITEKDRLEYKSTYHSVFNGVRHYYSLNGGPDRVGLNDAGELVYASSEYITTIEVSRTASASEVAELLPPLLKKWVDLSEYAYFHTYASAVSHSGFESYSFCFYNLSSGYQVGGCVYVTVMGNGTVCDFQMDKTPPEKVTVRESKEFEMSLLAAKATEYFEAIERFQGYTIDLINVPAPEIVWRDGVAYSCWDTVSISGTHPEKGWCLATCSIFIPMSLIGTVEK